MASINQISARIKTGNRGETAGTNGRIYLGIGGREFNLNLLGGSDFEAGMDQTFVLGEGANSGPAPADNDPRSPHQLVTENLDKYPIYVRFEPRTEDDRWDLDEISVTVNPGSAQIGFSALGSGSHIWFGNKSTKIFYFGAN